MKKRKIRRKKLEKGKVNFVPSKSQNLSSQKKHFSNKNVGQNKKERKKPPKMCENHGKTQAPQKNWP